MATISDPVCPQLRLRLAWWQLGMDSQFQFSFLKKCGKQDNSETVKQEVERLSVFLEQNSVSFTFLSQEFTICLRNIQHSGNYERSVAEVTWALQLRGTVFHIISFLSVRFPVHLAVNLRSSVNEKKKKKLVERKMWLLFSDECGSMPAECKRRLFDEEQLHGRYDIVFCWGQPSASNHCAFCPMPKWNLLHPVFLLHWQICLWCEAEWFGGGKRNCQSFVFVQFVVEVTQLCSWLLLAVLFPPAASRLRFQSYLSLKDCSAHSRYQMAASGGRKVSARYSSQFDWWCQPGWNTSSYWS